MGKFKVYVLHGQNTREVGDFESSDTVLRVKQEYYNKLDNSVSVNNLRFQFSNNEMQNNKTLGYYDNDVHATFGMIIQLLVRTDGGSTNYRNSLVVHNREYYCGKVLQVWDPKVKTPKYQTAIIKEVNTFNPAYIKIHWEGYDAKYDECIYMNDFPKRLEDFRIDDDSKMDDIKKDKDNSNANNVNQNASNNTGGNKKADTRVNVRKIRNISFKIGQEVQFNRTAMKGDSSWGDGILTGLMKKFGWKNFCKGRIVGFEIDKNTEKQGIIIQWVGYETFKATIWEDTFDFYLENMGKMGKMGNKGNYNTKKYMPSDVISIKPIGLPNLGNTCYFNAALQCLMSIPQLNKYIINLNKYPKKGIISSLKELYREGNSCSVRSIINQCSKLDSNIGSRRQYDSVVAFDIMRQLIDENIMNDNFKMISQIKAVQIRENPDDEDKSQSITDELCTKLEESKVRELMYGINVWKYSCLKCDTESNLYKAFGSISLSLKSANIEINVYPIISRNNKQDEWLKCGKPVTMKIRGKYKIENLKENILLKGNDSNKYNISIYSLNLSNQFSKWITYYNDNDYCERFNNENIVFAQIGIKNDKRIDVKCFDIFYDTNKKKIIKNDINNNVEFSVLKCNQNAKPVQGEAMYKKFGQKHSQYKLYIFHNNNFVRNESTVKVSSKSVLIFIWLNDINASANYVSLHKIVDSDNLKDIQDAKTAAYNLIGMHDNTKFAIIRDSIDTELTKEKCIKIDRILKAFKLRDNVIKLCKNTQKIKFNAAKANTVEDCLRIHEEIIPDDGLPCQGCGQKSLTMNKQVLVLKSPTVLLLEIDREVDEETNNRGYGRGGYGRGGYNSYGKSFNDVNIIYPINGLQFKDSIYNLYAISDHSGYSTSFGHYVSYVRREVNGKTLWYNCNDSSISRIYNPITNNKLQSNSAKLLVYIKQDNK